MSFLYYLWQTILVRNLLSCSRNDTISDMLDFKKKDEFIRHLPGAHMGISEYIFNPIERSIYNKFGNAAKTFSWEFQHIMGYFILMFGPYAFKNFKSFMFCYNIPNANYRALWPIEFDKLDDFDRDSIRGKRMLELIENMRGLYI